MPMTDEEVAALKAEHEKNTNAQKAEYEKLKAEHDKLTKKPDPVPEDLAAKAQKEREEKEKRDRETRSLESDIGFTMNAPKWLENNASLLPETIKEIFAQSEKEKYSSASEKARDLRLGIFVEYFAKQANLDLLTESQKNKVAAFKELTKDVKQERIGEIYESVFEPALESARQIKKAKELQTGLAATDGKQDAYKTKLISLSQKHHLRERKNA